MRDQPERRNGQRGISEGKFRISADCFDNMRSRSGEVVTVTPHEVPHAALMEAPMR